MNVEHEVKLRVPIHTLGGVVCFGQVSMSPFLMGFCAERGVLVSFLSNYGKFLARVQGPVSGNVLLRREQYRRADDPDASASMARFIVTAKIANCRTVLQRALRDHSEKVDEAAIRSTSARLSAILIHLQTDMPLDRVRGFEGEAGARP